MKYQVETDDGRYRFVLEQQPAEDHVFLLIQDKKIAKEIGVSFSTVLSTLLEPDIIKDFGGFLINVSKHLEKR